MCPVNVNDNGEVDGDNDNGHGSQQQQQQQTAAAASRECAAEIEDESNTDSTQQTEDTLKDATRKQRNNRRGAGASLTRSGSPCNRRPDQTRPENTRSAGEWAPFNAQRRGKWEKCARARIIEFQCLSFIYLYNSMHANVLLCSDWTFTWGPRLI